MNINTKKHHVQKKKRSQSGFSLIELLLAMMIGLFLLGGVITMFISTKGSDRTRDAISSMDANARAAISALRQSILHAGYPSMHNMPIDKAFFTTIDTPLLATPKCRGGAIDRDVALPAAQQQTRDQDGGGADGVVSGDVITVVSLADNPCIAGQASCDTTVANQNDKAKVFYDCGGRATLRDTRSVACSADPNAGMDNTMEAKIYSTFRIDSGALSCDGSRSGIDQVIADNIEAMQILYGVQKDDGTAVYKNATALDVESAWGSVISVQIALLVHSQDDLLDIPSTQNEYTLLDDRVAIAAELRRLYRVYTTTIHLANQNKGALLQ